MCVELTSECPNSFGSDTGSGKGPFFGEFMKETVALSLRGNSAEVEEGTNEDLWDNRLFVTN